MDFHSMPRRQLQALCKQNRVPANITNVAMADALQALHVAGSLENAQEALQDLTPHVPSSRKAASRRRLHAESVTLDSIETREQPASPLPRARRVTVKASEIWRLGVEGEEDGIEEEKKETLIEATPLTVTKCSSMKPPTRRLKKDVEAKEEQPTDAMKTPASLTGRRMATRKVAITPVAVDQEDGDTVVSARVTARRNKITRQSTRAATEDSATSTVRRSARIRAKTEESAVKIGSSFLEVELEQGMEIRNAPIEEVKNGEKDCDLVAVDTVVPQRSLEEAAITPKDKEFAAVSVGSDQKQLDKEEVDNHCEKDCNLVAVGANILINNLEENGKTPDAESTIIEKEVMDVATKEVGEAAEMAPKAEEFDDAKELGSVAQHHEEVDEIAPEVEGFADEELGSVVQHHEGVKIKDNFDGNEDEVCIDRDRIVESGATDANEEEVIQETEASIGELVPETDCEFKASPVQGIIISLENLVITKDDVAEHTEEEEDDEIKCATDEKGMSEEIDRDDEIPGVAVNSIIQNQVPSIPDSDNEVKVIDSDSQDEVSAIPAVNAGRDDEMLEAVKESDEISAKVEESPAKPTGEAIDTIEFQFSGADKENGIYSAELNTQVVVNDNEQNVLENLSLRKLKKVYKEKIISNVSEVETKRQALNDVNHSVV
ncbi:uncharacterized protein LOC121998079 isoform X1 [Zingiber officinale]|uniref:uncharacterized protein LOC121998079 isoform X1 n=1 Tax=Zingiber officinale TaxID=94328 RepID=UPI001C4C1CA6|nr:uncharacterized protein LOC121998079 isoform X1 [Zingiber officinale]